MFLPDFASLISFVEEDNTNIHFLVDVFGKRFEKELEQLRRDVERWQSSPGQYPMTPGVATPLPQVNGSNGTGSEPNYFNLAGSNNVGNNNEQLSNIGMSAPAADGSDISLAAVGGTSSGVSATDQLNSDMSKSNGTLGLRERNVNPS